MADQFDVRLLCSVSALSPSSYYYVARRREETELRAVIEAIALEFPCYGYRRMTKELGRRGWAVNGKQVLRLMREENLLVQVRRLVRTSVYCPGWDDWPNLVRGLEVARPNQVWVADITYIRVRSPFLFLAVLMDLYTRGIRGWHLGKTLKGELTQQALLQALARHGAPEIHHSDHGVQYLAGSYVEWLRSREIAISLSAVGTPTENAYAERLIRTLKEEEVYLSDYEDEVDARERIGYFLEEVYSRRRLHSSLGYVPPSEFEEAYYRGGEQ